eukprot:54726-Eustigmatos_ZCMA.PRE.1
MNDWHTHVPILVRMICEFRPDSTQLAVVDFGEGLQHFVPYGVPLKEIIEELEAIGGAEVIALIDSNVEPRPGSGALCDVTRTTMRTLNTHSNRALGGCMLQVPTFRQLCIHQQTSHGVRKPLLRL